MSSIHPITLPKWGLEMAEGTIAAWHVAEGDEVAKGADFVDIETEKIVNTLDLEKGGKVRRLLAKAGDLLPVGSLIAVIAPESVPDVEIDRFIASYRPIDASFEPDADAALVAEAPAAAPAPAALSREELRQRNDAARATPIARRIANLRGIDLNTLTGTGKGGRISQADVERATNHAGGGTPAASADAATVDPLSGPAAEAPLPEAIRAANEKVHASPIARKVANRLGLALGTIAGTGRKGRVSLADVETIARSLGLLEAPAPAEPAAPPVQAPVAGASPTAADTGSFVPFSAMRRSIAQTLVRAKQTVPHFYTTVDIEADALIDLRKRINANPTAGGKVSLNDFILRAAALALKQHPEVNVHVLDEGTRTFTTADIALAVAIEGGLVTPVIRDAGSKSVTDLSRAAAELAERARARALAGDDLKGATFTVSNLGMFGVREFDAIINPPQAAILAVGGVRREARERSDGGVAFLSVMSVTLSADHRAVDGALAARFLATLRAFIENPLSLLM